MDFQFLSFSATPDDEKQIGIAEILYKDDILLRYKITKGKDGKGFYVQAPALKCSIGFLPGFLLNSNIVSEAIMREIREKVTAELEHEMPF